MPSASSSSREPLWLGKEKLNQHSRCEGQFQAAVSGRVARRSRTRPRSAYGVLLHKAIEVEVGARDGMDPHQVAQVAVDRVLEREERFAEYWRELSAPEQDDVLMEVVRRVTLFQASFPPLKPLRRELAPISELRVRAELLGGDLVLSGQIDLVLGLPDKLEPTRATRLAVDLKTGGAYPEFAEDMRFYALVMTLRFGVPPYRAASLFLESGTWQSEDVTEELLVPRRRPGDRGGACRRRPGQRPRARSATRHVLRLVPPLVDVPGRRAPPAAAPSRPDALQLHPFACRCRKIGASGAAPRAVHERKDRQRWVRSPEGSVWRRPAGAS